MDCMYGQEQLEPENRLAMRVGLWFPGPQLVRKASLVGSVRSTELRYECNARLRIDAAAASANAATGHKWPGRNTAAAPRASGGPRAGAAAASGSSGKKKSASAGAATKRRAVPAAVPRN